MLIKLTPHNLFHAGMVGVSRHIKGASKKGRYGADNVKAGWQINCDGAAGEMAVAKAFNLYWDGALGNFNAKDVGKLQVRTNPNDWGDLILHPKDDDEDIFILVLSHLAPTYRLKGWLKGADGKLKKWWRDGAKGRPAYFVPQSALSPIKEIIELNHKNGIPILF